MPMARRRSSAAPRQLARAQLPLLWERHNGFRRPRFSPNTKKPDNSCATDPDSSKYSRHKPCRSNAWRGPADVEAAGAMPPSISASHLIIQYFLYYLRMKETAVIAGLSALAQPVRLRAFRLLVVAGPEGLTPSQLTESLGVAANALSFHLKELNHAGLITQERQGRNLIYRASFKTMNALLAYLTENCCEGAACLPGKAPSCDCEPH